MSDRKPSEWSLLSVEHETLYQYAHPVDQAHHLACLRPLHDAAQAVRHFDLTVQPAPLQIHHRLDAHGNSRAYFSLHSAHRELRVTAHSEVWVADRYRGLDPSQGATCDEVRDALVYRAHVPYQPAGEFVYPSPYVPKLEPLIEYAAPSLQGKRPLAEAVIELMQRIHADFEYAPASTDISTPVLDVFIEKKGVCQDFAHLMLACLRASGLAARYVSGYLLTRPPEGQAPMVGADASHAWVSVWVPGLGQELAGDWLDLDPTNACVPSTQHVRVAQGRDFGDVTPLRGVIRGGGEHTLVVRVTTRQLESSRITQA
ncbi:MAG: transglutaminase family protein [Burkholderiales bacterium]|nr:transglutaminase family protein [Burkholderiales bacterium]